MSYASFSGKTFDDDYDNDYDLWRLLLCRGSLVKMVIKHGPSVILTALHWHSCKVSTPFKQPTALISASNCT